VKTSVIKLEKYRKAWKRNFTFLVAVDLLVLIQNR